MQPIILTNAFRRPRGTRTSRGVTVCERTNVYACIEEMVAVIREDLRASPLLLPTTFDPESVAGLLRQIDGLFLPGAVSNIHPSAYGEEVVREGQSFDLSHDETDLFLVRKAQEMGIPFFGICRSMQAMNVAFGGTLSQKTEAKGIDHSCSDPCDGHDDAPIYMHEARVEEGGLLAPHFPDRVIAVNSMHEQAIDRLGRGLRVEARAPDGIIEAISLERSPVFFAAFQWHPEAMPKNPVSQKLFALFQKDVQRRFEARQGR